MDRSEQKRNIAFSASYGAGTMENATPDSPQSPAWRSFDLPTGAKASESDPMNHLLRAAVWAKCAWHSPLDPDLGQDAHGNFIRYSKHGDRRSEYGWEMDHYPVPASQGGGTELNNLRPLHWRANALHGAALSMTRNLFADNALRPRTGGMFGFGRRRP